MPTLPEWEQNPTQERVDELIAEFAGVTGSREDECSISDCRGDDFVTVYAGRGSVAAHLLRRVRASSLQAVRVSRTYRTNREGEQVETHAGVHMRVDRAAFRSVYHAFRIVK